ncbi:hypothetical protein H0H81_008742 [Sphagnurus paluster]|uniref:Uncharacterized protein n=1 Tax=Sphagnurus paluster TaxID=117069 RepID=A0A9P7GMU8_9AGAR|nr:hypothetical protein H0H81_008742 [Sphagnurus paluster]
MSRASWVSRIAFLALTLALNFLLSVWVPYILVLNITCQWKTAGADVVQPTHDNVFAYIQHQIDNYSGRQPQNSSPSPPDFRMTIAALVVLFLSGVTLCFGAPKERVARDQHPHDPRQEDIPLLSPSIASSPHKF